MTFRLCLIALFVCLSIADLALTLQLIDQQGGLIYESNPLAGWCMASFGTAGLTGFKAGMVVLILGLAAVICRYRPRTAGWFLTFACTVTAAVVLYSFVLGRALSGEYDISWLAPGPDYNPSASMCYEAETHDVEHLIDDLRSDDDGVREEAAMALAGLGEAALPAVPELVHNVVRHPDERSRPEQDALVRIGEPAVPCLEDALDTDNEPARKAAAHLLFRIRTSDRGDDDQTATEP